MSNILFVLACVLVVLGAVVFYKSVAWLNMDEPLSEHRRRVLNPASTLAQKRQRDLAVLRHKIEAAKAQAKQP